MLIRAAQICRFVCLGEQQRLNTLCLIAIVRQSN